jgi:CheY-like chemotaxis protein
VCPVSARADARPRRMLTKLGCVVDVAPDGRQGLRMLVGAAALPTGLAHGAGGSEEGGATPVDGDGPRTFDLVCLDNYMPVMTGEEAVRELRAFGRDDLVVGEQSVVGDSWGLADVLPDRVHGDGADGGPGELHRGGRGPRARKAHNAQVRRATGMQATS